MTPETANHPLFAAQLLRSGARAYASRAAERVIESRPEVANAFGDGAFRKWHDHLTQRVRELAAAVELSEPELFVTDVVWSRDAFIARNVPLDVLSLSLEHLAETLREDLPDSIIPAVEPCLSRAIAEAVGPTRSTDRLSHQADHGPLALRYLELALSGYRRDAIGLIIEQFEGGLAAADLYEHVLLAAEVEVGTMWHLGEITVSEEHVVTATTRAAMGTLAYVAGKSAAPHSTVGPVLLSTVEGDHHDLGVQAVADLFEIGGYRTVNLGANTPATDLMKAMRDFKPMLTVLSATMTTHLSAAKDAIAAIRSVDGNQPILVGGVAFATADHLARRIGATAYTTSGRSAVEWLDQAVARGDIPFG